ncbi:putative membrane protein [Arthrobacter pigmenti]|uniref:Putative membrane protein n=1 Tax=Arthrobacter pigmenti TaxID=271432 RepID=A0A846RJH6_9MICC|nr:hypothetical protein [Arthrobacter pigmenti]NJC23393.1 putative membrane protein [Arthrobacter pigmenti]
MSTPSHDPQPPERDPDKLSGTDPLNPAEPGPAQNSAAGLSPEPQKPATDDHQQQSGSPYGYQAAQPSGYAYPGSASMPQAQRPPMPKEVNWAFWLIIAAGVVSLISAFIPIDSSQVPSELQSTIAGFAIGGGIVALAIYVLLAVFIRKGHNWARITATVLAALSLVGLFTGSILGIVSILLGVVGVVLCYLKQSNPYFKPKQPQY